MRVTVEPPVPTIGFAPKSPPLITSSAEAVPARIPPSTSVPPRNSIVPAESVIAESWSVVSKLPPWTTTNPALNTRSTDALLMNVPPLISKSAVVNRSTTVVIVPPQIAPVELCR
jgi:hypothetical protein